MIRYSRNDVDHSFEKQKKISFFLPEYTRKRAAVRAAILINEHF